MERWVGSSRKSGARKSDEDFLHEFTLAEIMEMENIYREVGKDCLLPEFCQSIATSFSNTLNRAGKSVITWEQVQIWFQNKHKVKQAKAAFAPIDFKSLVDFSCETVPINVPESSHQKRKAAFKVHAMLTLAKWNPFNEPPIKDPDAVWPVQDNCCKTADLQELAFEALSAKDTAWYDVDSFLSYKNVRGELEVRVRFSGFNNAEDEWVSVRKGVRERSIPVEPFECQRVKVGDLILCFQEREDRAVYCDAHVMEIQRKLHDIRGCRCIFVVRYDHDFTVERVDLKMICCRPTQ